jgi:hypothetical protein
MRRRDFISLLGGAVGWQRRRQATTARVPIFRATSTTEK